MAIFGRRKKAKTAKQPKAVKVTVKKSSPRKCTKPCPHCNGTGLDQNDFSKLCEHCEGSGSIRA